MLKIKLINIICLFIPGMLTLVALFLMQCGSIPGVGMDLTDEQVQQYIRAYKKLRKVAPQAAQELAEKGESADIEDQVAAYQKINEAIKSEGFESYADFVRVNGQIAWAFSTLQAQDGMQKFEKMNKIGQEVQQQYIDDPDVPEEVKAQLREDQKKLQENWDKNAKYARPVIKMADWMTNEHNLEVVGRHKAELLEAFVGFKVPEPEFFGRKL